MEYIKLFANGLSLSTIRSTYDKDEIELNIYRIDKCCNTSLQNQLKKDGLLATIIPVFQFICLIFITTGYYQMSFQDVTNMTEDDAFKAFKSVDKTEEGEYDKAFLSAYYTIKEDYSKMSVLGKLVNSLDEFEDNS